MNIHQELKTVLSKPSPVLRVYISKGRHDKRPLGIPIVEDRIILQAFRHIIEQIFEKDFSECSFGFRNDRCCHDAITQLNRLALERQRKSRSGLKLLLEPFRNFVPLVFKFGQLFRGHRAMQGLVVPGSHTILGGKPRTVARYGNIAELLPFKNVKSVLPILGG